MLLNQAVLVISKVSVNIMFMGYHIQRSRLVLKNYSKSDGQFGYVTFV